MRALSGSFLVQMGGMAIAFVSSWFLVRLTTAEQYGLYIYALSVVGLLGGMAAAAFDDLSVRQVAAYQSQQKHQLLLGIIKTGAAVTLGLSFLFALIVYTVPQSIAQNQHYFNQNKNLLLLSAILLPLWALTQWGQALLRGSKFVVYSQLPDALIRPILFLLLVILGNFVCQIPSDANTLLIRYTIAAVLSLLICLWWVNKKVLGSMPLNTPKAHYDTYNWSKAAGVFFLISSLNLINLRTDVLAIGGLLPSTDLAYYNIGAKLSELLKMAFVVSNMVFAPLIAHHFAQQNTTALQRLATRSAWLSVGISLPLVLLLLLLGKPILMWWGSPFATAYAAMMVLCAGQMFNLGCGLAGNLLAMTGNERWIFVSIIVSTIANVALNLWLIPQHGILGAAYATTISTVLKNLIWVIVVYNKLGINATILQTKI
ncbi:MAG: oligosaccharide flippase family protein [Chitinophagales bacterium]|nr:oligosaccharide flippase family protein [Chitinophagales bacterium]